MFSPSSPTTTTLAMYLGKSGSSRRNSASLASTSLGLVDTARLRPTIRFSRSPIWSSTRAAMTRASACALQRLSLLGAPLVPQADADQNQKGNGRRRHQSQQLRSDAVDLEHAPPDLFVRGCAADPPIETKRCLHRSLTA